MTIAEFDNLDDKKKKELLTQCCGSSAWVEKMLSAFPVEDLVDLEECAEEKWYECSEEDWREAFEHHPKIGDINSLKEKPASRQGNLQTANWAEREQGAVANTSEEVLKELAEYNQLYEKKFSYIFIVCATGKSAEEMLKMLKERINNVPEEEMKVAAEEHLKITKLRLEKLFA